MKEFLADKKIQQLIKRASAILIIGVIFILVVIPGVRESDFAKVKKYEGDIREDPALKQKQQMLEKWQYDTYGGVESSTSMIYRIGDFTVNVRGSRERKLILNISVQYSNDDVPTELKNRNPVIRNAVISTCSDAQYLESIRGKELLKSNLKDSINGVISEGEVTEVYLNRFLIQ